MLSNYKLNKIQKTVKTMYNDGKTNRAIGKYLNNFLTVTKHEQIKTTNIIHANNIETSVIISNDGGMSKNQIKTFKSKLYKKLKDGKKMLGIKNFMSVEYSTASKIIDNIPFNKDKRTNATLVVFKWQNIKSLELHYTSKLIPKTDRKGNKISLQQIKNIVLFEIKRVNQSANIIRLVDMSFRYFRKKPKKSKK